jgi:hypothetical protein
VTATRLARRAGAGGDELAAAYLPLLDHIGCTAGNLSFTAYVVDEMTGRERVGTADATEPRAMAGLTRRNVFGDGPSAGCAGQAAGRAQKRSEPPEYSRSGDGPPAMLTG